MKDRLYNLLLRIPHFDITRDDDGSLYLRRFFLLGRSASGSTGATETGFLPRVLDALPFRIYLHEIRRSDSDACPHNHPWAFWSLILWGGYTEVVYEREWDALETSSRAALKGHYWRRPGSLRFCPANTIHRVRLDCRWKFGCPQTTAGTPYKIRREIMEQGHPERTAWTLVITGRRVQDWGFFTRRGWVQWREFLKKSKDVRDREC